MGYLGPLFVLWASALVDRFTAWVKRQKWIVWLWKNRVLSVIPLMGFFFKTNKLNNDLDLSQKKIGRLSESNAFLRERLLGQRVRLDDFQNPTWEKLKAGDRFIMLKVNKAYADSYLKSLGLRQVDYIGRTDFDIQDSAAAMLYYMEDLEVSLKGGQKVIASMFKDREGNKKEILVIKWRRIDRRDTIVMGEAIDLEKVREALEELDNETK